MKPRLKTVVWIAAGLGTAALLYWAFQPSPVLVDSATVRSGTLQVTVDDDGRTRVRERYTISAPIHGRLLRTPLDPGDAVHANKTLVAEFLPIAPDLLDARSRSELVARKARAEAARLQTEAHREQARAEAEFAAAELSRARELTQSSIGPGTRLEQAERDDRRAHEALRASEFAVQVATFDLEMVRATLQKYQPDDSPEGAVERIEDSRMTLHSPVDGKVLRLFEESARTMAAGTPILEVGNTGALEIVADYLSQDAVKVQPGMAVFVEGWGGELPSGEEKVLRGSVRVVEPGGFTKISALGVEEQRVNVIVDPDGDMADWESLGDGYRVELRILLWQEDEVLIVPTGALFRAGDDWAVLVVADDRAELRTVEIGRRNGLEAQVLGGLIGGDRVVLYPSELVSDGTKILCRS